MSATWQGFGFTLPARNGHCIRQPEQSVLWNGRPPYEGLSRRRPTGQRLVLFLAFGGEVVDLRFVHPRRDVALFVQHPPDVNVFVALYVEDQIGVAPKAPEPQIREPQLVRIAR